jgi:NAD+ diphosphatase
MPETKYCSYCGGTLTNKVIDGVERLACKDASCGYVFWDNPLPVVTAIIEHEGCVLLARNKAWPEKMYGLITGFLEKEETGLDSQSIDFVGLYPFFQRNQLLIAYHVLATGTICMGDELADIKPVAFDKIKPWSFGTGLALQDWLERKMGKGVAH